MYNVFGFCNLHHSPSLGQLTESRSLASTSFLGRYAFIDFTLSNFSNSNIDEVGILLKEHQRSLIKHLGFASSWNINTKLGHNTIMYNERYANNPRYNTDINNIKENDWVLIRSKADYIVVAPVHFVMSIDYRKVIDEHIKNKAEITVVYKHVDNGKKHFLGCDSLRIENGLIKSIRENKGASDEVDISLETYVINRQKFEQLVNMASEISSVFTLKDIISYVAKTEPVNTYMFEGFVRCYDTFNHYLEYSLELLNYSVRQKLFLPDWPIYTVTHDTPPAKYGKDAKVSNSFIANGAVVDGTVQGSILSRRVVVSKGAKIVNSIVLTDTIIGENARLENVVVDKYARIIHVKDLKGSKNEPLYIKQGDKI